MRKRILVGLIACIIAFSVTGCGKGAETVKDTKEVVNESVDKAQEKMKELQNNLE